MGPAMHQHMMPLLGEVLKQFLQLSLAHMRANHTDPKVQTLACQLFAPLAADPAGRARRCLDCDKLATKSHCKTPSHSKAVLI